MSVYFVHPPRHSGSLSSTGLNRSGDQVQEKGRSSWISMSSSEAQPAFWSRSRVTMPESVPTTGTRRSFRLLFLRSLTSPPTLGVSSPMLLLRLVGSIKLGGRFPSQSSSAGLRSAARLRARQPLRGPMPPLPTSWNQRLHQTRSPLRRCLRFGTTCALRSMPCLLYTSPSPRDG